MPFPGEHSCRISPPANFVRFRRNNSTSPHTIIGFREDGTSDLQSFRYPKDGWTPERARHHCQEHDGSFEAAGEGKEEDLVIETIDDEGTPPANKGEGFVDELKFGVPIQIDDIKALADGWEVAGYASTFDNVDLGDDQMLPNAFDRTLRAGHKIKFLHSHDPRMVLGLPKTLKPDKKGLFGRHKISQTRLGEDTRTLLQDGALDSFSIGYRAKQWEMAGNVRQLKDVDLWEISLVALPMNTQAVVTDVKSYLTALGLETQPNLSLSEMAAQLNSALNQFIGSARELVNRVDRPLTHKKRTEIAELLELCSGMDAVRSELSTVLETAPTTRYTDAKRIRHELESHRRRLAHVLKEDSHEYDRRGSPLRD